MRYSSTIKFTDEQFNKYHKSSFKSWRRGGLILLRSLRQGLAKEESIDNHDVFQFHYENEIFHFEEKFIESVLC